ncbi:histidine kinase [Dyadobacter jejuensis]|uniref:histidine kinase n=1 Tax=Dyadobacter jejuensis TaxID=1082580 RepID=A0A316AT48_9BACT|nr:ATP-binding protein [Dyadobacter jejuensis]PWJ60479.1 histidine kinase [Dyadobacter jejuensis]
MNTTYDIAWMVGASTVIFLTILFIISMIVLYFKRQLHSQKEKEGLQATYEKELLQARIEVQNETLRYITQELHDNVGQLLAVAHLNLNILEDNPEMDPTDYIHQTIEIIRLTTQEVRTLTKRYNSDFVRDFGLQESLIQELERIEKTKKFEVSWESAGKSVPLGYEKEIVLFRIAQEVLTNIIKHAQAKSIAITLHYSSNLLTLSFRDDGKGFSFATGNQVSLVPSGAGLRNIQRRAQLIQGSCTITSSQDCGTNVSITVPLEQAS